MIAQIRDFDFVSQPISMLRGQSEKLPYRFWYDDFEPVEVPYMIVSRDIPQAGWMQAQSIEYHHRELFGLGFDDDDYNDDEY